MILYGLDNIFEPQNTVYSKFKQEIKLIEYPFGKAHIFFQILIIIFHLCRCFSGLIFASKLVNQLYNDFRNRSLINVVEMLSVILETKDIYHALSILNSRSNSKLANYQIQLYNNIKPILEFQNWIGSKDSGIWPQKSPF